MTRQFFQKSRRGLRIKVALVFLLADCGDRAISKSNHHSDPFIIIPQPAEIVAS
jgi:hypothetical protein